MKRTGRIIIITLLLSACLIGCSSKKKKEEKPTLYTITFDTNGGSSISSITQEAGTSINRPSIPSKTDYTFVDWSSNKDNLVEITWPLILNENKTIYAIWERNQPDQFTVTFNTDGGNAISPVKVASGETINEPTTPTKDGYKFTGWSSEKNSLEAVVWPLQVTSNMTLYAFWNEKVDIKGYLSTLVDTVNQDPYGYIPNNMKPTYSSNHVKAEDVNYDFTKNTQISDVKYGGFGEQWNMVIDNIIESQRFYAVLALSETAINTSVILFNNFLDSNISDEASHDLNEASYTAKINFSNNKLIYTIKLKSGFTIPLFGEIIPQIDMSYDITSKEKTVRVQLNSTNSLKYVVTENSYKFALQYGIEAVSRKAYFEINKGEITNELTGSIYEYVQYKEKDLVPSCAEFYIDNNYATTVGNKASGMIGFKGYICELYQTNNGKLLAYEVRETLKVVGVEGTYNTLWFNLSDITGINSIRAVENENLGIYGSNNHDIYVNGSSKIFEPTKNTKLGISTSRKYDIEFRKQYFYGYVDDELVKYEVSIPMLFVQADNKADTNYSDFSKDILSKSDIVATINVSDTIVNTLESNYAEYVDIFIEHIELMSGAIIEDFIGNPEE